MDGGIFTLYKINQELKQQKLENELLKKRQTYLEERVNKLEEDKNFDYDYFEEILRKKLGVIKPSEKVIFVENNQEEKNGK
jgi:cell division protein FtsB